MPKTSFTDHPELRTLRDLLRYAISRFEAARLHFGHGSDNAWDEAAYLLLHSLHLPLDTLEPFMDATVLPQERHRFLAFVHQRVTQRVPAAYLTGEAWLQGHRFTVDPRVLIPRSPMAELLSDQLAPWVEEPAAVRRVMDLCTGSGCLAILAALAFEHATVDAVDLSEDALAVAAVNIADYGLADRVRPLRSDLLDDVPPAAYDLVLCNPPYVNQGSMQALPPEYRHEPALALAGGEDGMDLVRRLLAALPAYLAPGGLLVLEIGNEREHFEAAFPSLAPVWLQTAAAGDQLLLLTREQLAA